MAQDRSINTLPSTTSPTNTKRQTKSMPSSKATRRRPTPSEPRVTRPRRRVSDFHTRSLCTMGIVVSIRNVACPQARPNAMLRPASTYHAGGARPKIPEIRATRPGTAGHLARASLRDEAFRDIALVLPALRDHDLARLRRCGFTGGLVDRLPPCRPQPLQVGHGGGRSSSTASAGRGPSPSPAPGTRSSYRG